MTEGTVSTPIVATHGAKCLPRVQVDSYNVEIRDNEGFIGDRASNSAFWNFVENWREPLRKAGDDPIGNLPSEELSKKDIDALLVRGDPEAAGVLQGAIEDFSQEFAVVIRRFLRLKAWQDTERLVIGGGFRASRVGELAIGRTAILLKAGGVDVELTPIRNDPDAAGIIGSAHLAPTWMFKGFDAVLGVDIGGTNIRAGLVQLNLKKASDLSRAEVVDLTLWQHGEEDDVKREHAVDWLAESLGRLIKLAAKKDIKLAPFVGIGCPGKIEEDGSIDRGAQNLPGNWTSSRFNLPAELRMAIPRVGDHETAIVMHNDAVVQGLSEAPFMWDVERWGVFTIGTGLGNARFTNRGDDKST